MMEAVKPCQKCGQQNAAQARFCSQCGGKLLESAYAPTLLVPQEAPVSPPSGNLPQTRVVDAYAPYDSPPVNMQPAATRRIPAWVWLVVGAMGCLGVVVIAGFVVLLSGIGVFMSSPTSTPYIVYAASTATSIPVQPAPATAAPVSAASSLTGQQQLTDERLFDDFSSDALGWAQDDNPVGASSLQDGGYVLSVKVANKGIFTRVPLKMNPNHIQFKAKVLSGGNGGLYGVRCLRTSEENYYEVWLDPSIQSYKLLQFEAGASPAVWIDWKETSAFNQDGREDDVIIECLPGMISLWLNGSPVFDQTVQAENGVMYLVVKTYIEMTQPFVVRFDDVEAWKQMQ
jgi:hypothetical protein